MNLEDQPIPASTRVADLVEQIQRIDKMIELHADTPFMRDQYKRRKQEWVDEFAQILRDLNLLDGNLIAA